MAFSALTEEGATVAELANRLGYRSEAAFARAFKRVTGIPPGAVRRTGETETHTAADGVAAGAANRN
jgi:AraC-like DNA-binding protein